MIADHTTRPPAPARHFEQALTRDIVYTSRVLLWAYEQFVGVTAARVQLLVQLDGDKELSQAELQQRLGVDGAAITRQVKQLEAEGLLTRRPDAADNRFMLVSLTAAGRQLLEELASRRQAFETIVAQGFTPDELKCFHSYLRRARENMLK